MAKRALGPPWKDQPPEKQQEFVRLFKAVVFDSYVDKVEMYSGSMERIVYESEEIDGNYALVKTKVLGYKNTDIQAEYRLRFDAGEWKVYDVVIEGISLVNNYRSQFNSILANQSFDNLLKLLRQKAESQKGS
jgi:phospholipid transport system substrate-binding protein